MMDPVFACRTGMRAAQIKGRAGATLAAVTA